MTAKFGNFRLAAAALLPVLGAILLGQTATYPNLASWYAGLDKPSFTPPNWLFAPAWTTLYALMAFASWRLLALPRAAPGRSAALAAYYTQLALNIAWSWMFFAAQSPLLGLINVIPQFALVLLTIRLAWPIDRFAALALMPLAGWVAFATALNAAIWWLNG